MLSLIFAVALYGSSSADTVFAVDLYGLRTVSQAAVRAAVGLRPGDVMPATLDPVRSRLRVIPGVAEVDVSAVCCSENGRTVLYVGIREVGTAALTYRAAPGGTARLPAEIVTAGSKFESALMSAVRRGAAEEDDSRGYALARDSAVRALQEQFLTLAARHFDTLAIVLRTSADADQRALSAQVLAYGTNRRRVAQELLYAVTDADDDVRNNAVRALAVLARWADQQPQRAGITIPAEPFLALLNSVSWTDRNKATFALMSLTASRDTALLSLLRARALTPLVEMARWSNPGHALVPFLILARIAGLDDAAAFQAWQTGNRETVIARAAQSQRQ